MDGRCRPLSWISWIWPAVALIAEEGLAAGVVALGRSLALFQCDLLKLLWVEEMAQEEAAALWQPVVSSVLGRQNGRHRLHWALHQCLLGGQILSISSLRHAAVNVVGVAGVDASR